LRIGENLATVTPYGSQGAAYHTVGSVGRGQRGSVHQRAGMRLIMRTLIGAVIGALIALVFGCSAARAEWASNTVHDNMADADESDVDALAICEG
jgi:hypothetical protein